MEAWRQWLNSAGETNLFNQDREESLDSDRPSHGRRLRVLTSGQSEISGITSDGRSLETEHNPVETLTLLFVARNCDGSRAQSALD